MIELLMVIMLVAILGSVAITQYLDFRKEGKEAAAAQVAASLNTAIKLQFVQSTLRCNNTERLNPPLDSLQANDVTAGTNPICTTAQVTNQSDRMFLDSGAGVLPTNPYNNLKTVGDCVSTTYVGWCYDAAAGVVTPSYTTDPP